MSERITEIGARLNSTAPITSPADVAYLLAELRKRDDALARVEAVAEWIRDNHGDYISREIEERLRAALDDQP